MTVAINSEQEIGETVNHAHFSSPQPDLPVNGKIFETTPASSVKKTDTFSRIADIVNADDIFVMGQFSFQSDWIMIHLGQQCIDCGLDFQKLAASSATNGNARTFAEAYWVHPPYAIENQIVRVLTLRGSKNEHFVVGLLFNPSSGDSKICTEAVIEHARPLLLSVIELNVHTEKLRILLHGSNAALDRSDAGIILLDASCNIVYENKLAKDLLNLGSGLRRRGLSVAANDMGDALRLRVAIEHVLAADEADGVSPSVPLLTLQRGKEQRALLALIIPTPVQLDSAQPVSLMIFLFDPERKIGHLLQSACRLYRLSPVEADLACHLACGESIATAAAALKIKELTARGYLKQIFIKTGVNRQAALVQLLLSSMVHLGNDPELVVM
jgi:DNA-binding CsgD family transcriptional regulator